MSISEDKIEQERIARQAAIKQALEADADSKAEPTVQPAQPMLYPPLASWECVVTVAANSTDQ